MSPGDGGPGDAPEAPSGPVEVVRDLLLAARRAHGREATARLEDAFLRWAGRRPRTRSEMPYQRPTLFVPGFDARPWVDAASLPGVAALEAAYPTIRAEFEAARARRDTFQAFDDGTPHDGTWGALYIRYGAAPVERSRAACPRTVEIVNALPGVGEMAMFSALGPGSTIRPHCGVNNLRYTAHLGLEIPPGCSYRVADETRCWQEGRCLVFDDSFEHEARNPSDRVRHVLLVDFWHPELTQVEVGVLEKVASHLASLRSRLDEGVGGWTAV